MADRGSARFSEKMAIPDFLMPMRRGAARQILPDGREDRRHPELHRGVDVVAAGVGYPHLLAQEGVLLGRLEREIGLLDHRQGVHVGADGDQRPRLAPLEQGDHARLGDAGAGVEPEATQVGGHRLGGLALAVGELGILMDAVADLDELGRHLLRLLVDPCVEGIRGRRAGRRQGRAGQQGEPERGRRQADPWRARGHAFLRATKKPHLGRRRCAARKKTDRV